MPYCSRRATRATNLAALVYRYAWERNMTQQSAFGKNWEEVVDTWYLDTPPKIDASIGMAALLAIERFWPAYVEEIVARGARGPAIIAPVIDLGQALLACVQLDGFGNVLKRCKGGEHSALSEIHVLAALVAMGYSPEIEPLLINGKRPDSRVSVDGMPVYLEVVAPSQSLPIRRAYAKLQQVAELLRDESNGGDIEVSYVANCPLERFEEIVPIVRSIASEETTIVTESLGLGTVHISQFNEAQRASIHSFNSDDLPVIVVVSFSFGPEKNIRVTVRLPIADDRAQELLEQEASHFLRSATNFLVLDVSSIPSGLRRWRALIERRFQPTINQRFGAALLIDRCTQDGYVLTRWTVIRNPYARNPVPESLLGGLTTLVGWEASSAPAE